MKIALILVVFSSSVIGVFADTDKVKSVSVMEGDSVTLHTGVTKIQGSDSIEWRFNGTRMAKIDSDTSSTEGPFRDTMKLNNITGELKITDVRPTDSGLYKLKIKSSSGSTEMTFSVTVISSGVKSASVMEGDSVTLRSGVNGLQRDNVIQWRHQNILIAEIINETPSIHTYNSESLKLDKQTGSLTITNIKTEHAGDYEVDVAISSRSSKSRYTIHKSFSVNVSDELKSVTEGDSVTLNSGLTEIQRDNVIRWRFKKTTIAEIIKADQRFFTDDYVLDGRFRDRLKLDNRTGSLNITNIRNTDSGDYEVEISTNRFTVHKRISVTIDERQSVSVTEGDSVTLNSDLTELQRVDVICWSFGKTTIAEIIKADQRFPTDDGPDGRFRDRLKLDNRTGSLTITNITNTDSGVYKVEISTNRFIVHKRISVTVNEAVKLVLVKEGDSVTLHTGASEIQGYDAVLWYGDKGVLITPSPGSVDARWKNTVQNGQTGDLTIRNIRRDQSGDYKVVFVNINGVSKHKKFHIYITGVFSDETDGVKTVSVIKGDSVFLDTSVTEIQNGDLIEWLFGPQNIIIAKTDGKTNSIYNEKDVRFKLDKQTGSLIIKNSNIEHSGHYQLKIINNNTYTIQKSFSVTVHPGLSPAVPDPGQSSGAVAGIVVAVLAVAAAVGGLIYYRHKSSKPERSSEENGQNHTSNKDEETELTKPVET